MHSLLPPLRETVHSMSSRFLSRCFSCRDAITNLFTCHIPSATKKSPGFLAEQRDDFLPTLQSSVISPQFSSLLLFRLRRLDFSPEHSLQKSERHNLPRVKKGRQEFGQRQSGSDREVRHLSGAHDFAWVRNSRSSCSMLHSESRVMVISGIVE